MWEDFGKAGSEGLECCKLSLKGNFGESSKDHNADRNADDNGHAQDASVMNKRIPLAVTIEIIYVLLMLQ